MSNYPDGMNFDAITESDAPAGLTRDVADNFKKHLLDVLSDVTRDAVEMYGMDEYMDKFQIAEFVYHITSGAQDAIGDMPIWDIVKRGEA